MKLSTKVQNSKYEGLSYAHRFLVTVDRGPKADYSNVKVHDVEVCLSFRLTARCSVINAWIANRLAWLWQALQLSQQKVLGVSRSQTTDIESLRRADSQSASPYKRKSSGT